MNILGMLFGDSGVTIDTPISQLDNSTIRSIVKQSTRYCTLTFGTNKNKRTEFTVSIREQTGGDPAYGQYCPVENRLTIHYNHCPRVRQMVQTLLHEYCHYLQPVTKHYNRLLERHGYDNHPMEVEARKFERDHLISCWNFVKPRL